MKLIVGLGNPGVKYRYTRHNTGKMLVEYVAEKLSQKWEKKLALQASVASLSWEGNQLLLAYPETFMNVSGETVKKLVQFYEVNIAKDLLIALDDIALPFGRLRLRSKGSDGGHNGLKSIQRLLASQNYARLRVGVGDPKTISAEETPQSLDQYVLDSWSKDQRKDLPVLLDHGFEAIRLWVSRGIEEAMNVINPLEK